MQIELVKEIGEAYQSNSQKARIITEGWVSDNMYCPRCGHLHINHFENNRPVADFFCPRCHSQFELKSNNGKMPNSIVDGTYRTMIERILSLENPDFFFMTYNKGNIWSVNNFYFIPKHFFTPEIIKKRKPLSPKARRAGWIGCNIQVSGIPKAGKIPIIENGMIQDKAKIIEKVSVADALNLSNMESRGWLYDVMSCIDKIDSRDFTLKEMYQFESVLFQKHPNNHNIQAKIRQQLQLLRDKGFIEFTGRGEYRKVL